ncbi:MAG: hypothetical protein Q9221_003544 [Calogaya cf. arnoldii]
MGSQAASGSHVERFNVKPEIDSEPGITYTKPEPVDVYVAYYIENGQAPACVKRVFRSSDAAINYCGFMLGFEQPAVLNQMGYWLRDGLWVMDDVNHQARCMIQQRRLNREAPIGTLTLNTRRSDPRMVYLVCGFSHGFLLESGLFGGFHLNGTQSCAVLEVCENFQRAWEMRVEFTGRMNAARGPEQSVGAEVHDAWLH